MDVGGAVVSRHTERRPSGALRFPLLLGVRLVRPGRVAAVLTAALLVHPGAVRAQTRPVGDSFDPYLRMLQLANGAELGSYVVRPLSARQVSEGLTSAGHPWREHLRLGPTGSSGAVEWRTGDTSLELYVNSGFPWGWNDGALWKGKGLTSSVRTTSWIRWRGLSVTLDPRLIHVQNTGFELMPHRYASLPEYAYPLRIIDYPQRFGSEAFWSFDLGQSRVSADWRGARFAFGNENLWWGPGIQNAIVMSSNAPGFLHGSLSTNRPVETGIGRFEGQWIWGGLGQSDYFDPSFTPTDRFITGAVFSYSPSFIDGLTVGATRVFQQLVPESGLEPSEYLVVFQGLLKEGFVTPDRPQGNDERDQIVSLFARWLLPESGFEAYVEWARNDHALNFEDLILQPEHSQGYTVGFQKLTSFDERRAFVLRGELTHLERASTWVLWGSPTYYVHHVVRQGYTHQGQILGAMVGPGGNGQYLGVDWYERWGSATLYAQRRVANNDAYYQWTERNGPRSDSHDVSFDFGLTGRKFVGRWELGGAFVFTRQLNRFITGPHITNVHLGLSAHWRPGE